MKIALCSYLLNFATVAFNSTLAEQFAKIKDDYKFKTLLALLMVFTFYFYKQAEISEF